MPGSHARRSSSTSTTGKRRSSKSHVFPICSPINARWSPSVVPIRTLERDVESGVAFADYDGLVERCVELLGDERARRELAERGYQTFSARSQADILDRALADLEGVTHETAARDDPGSHVRLEDKDHSADHAAPRAPTVQA